MVIQYTMENFYLELWEHLILCGGYSYVSALVTFNVVQRKRKWLNDKGYCNLIVK